VEELLKLEALARTLEPDASERGRLIEAAIGYAEDFLVRLPELPGYVEDDDRALEALPVPIVREEPDGLTATLETLWEGVDRIGVNEMAGHFFGFIPGPSLYASAVADYLATVTNRYAGVYFGSPGAVRLQRRLLEWLGAHSGYPADAGGDFTSGGSTANLIAIVTARDAATTDPAEYSRLTVYVTEHTHHSIHKALRIAGLGRAPVRTVPVDERFRMDTDSLERQVAADDAAGLRPWLVIGSAGTTDTGSIDPLADIAEIAERHDLWFHVDGAYGGAFVLCEEGRRRLAGIERSHSLVMDPHKGMFVPHGTGVVLVKDRSAMARSHGYRGAYMQDADHDEPSPADLSPELSRPNRVLRVWLPLRLHGVAPFRAALEEKLTLARLLHQKLTEIPDVEVGPEPDLSVVTFWCSDDEATRRLHHMLTADGRAFLSSTSIAGRYTLRIAVLNARTHLEHIERALDAIRELTPLALRNQG